MPRHLAAGAIATLVLGAVLAAAPPKTKPKPAPKPSAPPLAVTTPVLTTPMPIACPDALGQGVKSGRVFCEVPVSHDPAHGDLIVVPRHQGPAFVRFHLHNRQLVSASLIKAKRAFTRATATVVVVKADGTILGRGTVQTEFRQESDLFDRVPAGPGAKGSKAVAPIGDELVEIQVPEDAESVTVVGEKVQLVQIDGTQTLSSDGVSVAFISSAQIAYRAAPAPKLVTPTKKKPAKKAATKKAAPKKTATKPHH
jgi:hypothetical protein